MKTKYLNLILALAGMFLTAAPAETHKAIPFDQIGAVAGKQYSGDGLAVASGPDGARLRCAFQRLNARVTAEGLWFDFGSTAAHLMSHLWPKRSQVGIDCPAARGLGSLEEFFYISLRLWTWNLALVGDGPKNHVLKRNIAEGKPL